MLRGLSTHPFARFVVKKAVFYLIVTFVALNFIFFMRAYLVQYGESLFRHPSINPGLGYDPFIPLETQLKEYFGVNKSFFDQYTSFWGQVFTGNLGPSYPIMYPKGVTEIVLSRLPFTLVLVIPVFVTSFFLGNWIGVKAATAGGKRSGVVHFFSALSSILPSYWFGIVLFFLFAATVKIFPQSELAAPAWSFSYFLDVLYHYALPFLTLFIIYLGGWIASTRSMVIGKINSGYMRYSEQVDLKKSKLTSYAERNARLPQFTSLNLLFTALVGETVIIEIIFGWPGIGRIMYDSILSVDYPLFFGSFLVIMFVVILGNFLIDILCGFIDTRIRTGRS